jgi:hypothetical protein
MEKTDLIAVFSLAAAGVLFLVAAILHLARETNGVPRNQRLAVMAALAWQLLHRRLPSRHSMVVAAAGFSGFILFGLLCTSICWGLLWWYASTLPRDDNVVAGAAEAALLMLYGVAGLVFSLVVGSVCGCVVAASVDNLLSRRSERN